MVTLNEAPAPQSPLRYVIVWNYGAAMMSDRVSEYLARGWTLFGDPGAVPTTDGVLFYQAMITTGKQLPDG